jgi:hypothetical protein
MSFLSLLGLSTSASQSSELSMDNFPHYDGDPFMAELAALPDQDETEEVMAAGIW